jgi:hypothetical protein
MLPHQQSLLCYLALQQFLVHSLFLVCLQLSFENPMLALPFPADPAPHRPPAQDSHRHCCGSGSGPPGHVHPHVLAAEPADSSGKSWCCCYTPPLAVYISSQITLAVHPRVVLLLLQVNDLGLMGT